MKIDKNKIQNKFQQEKSQRGLQQKPRPNNIEKLIIPEEFNSDNKLLLHSCCAPCSADLIQRIVDSGIELTIFFYNPNIHPKKEYEIRKNENIRFAEKLGIDFVDADYDIQDWFKRAKGLENEAIH